MRSVNTQTAKGERGLCHILPGITHVLDVEVKV